MKVLIVFTTPNTNGSEESYNDTWDCIKKINGHREKGIDDDKIYVLDGIDFRKPNNGWNYNALCSKINEIKQCHADASFIVLFHAGETELTKLKQKCNHSHIIFKRYSTNDDIWTYINNVCNNQQNKSIKDNFIDLWAHLKTEDDLIKIHSLRYEILSPFVALDLIKQAEANSKNIKIDGNIKTNIKKAISELTKNDKGEKNPIAVFCDKYIKCDEFREKLNGLLKVTDRDWNDYHRDLEDVAKKMEEQIASIEA
jgi:hypothetical protein